MHIRQQRLCYCRKHYGKAYPFPLQKQIAWSVYSSILSSSTLDSVSNFCLNSPFISISHTVSVYTSVAWIAWFREFCGAFTHSRRTTLFSLVLLIDTAYVKFRDEYNKKFQVTNSFRVSMVICEVRLLIQNSIRLTHKNTTFNPLDLLGLREIGGNERKLTVFRVLDRRENCHFRQQLSTKYAGPKWSQPYSVINRQPRGDFELLISGYLRYGASNNSTCQSPLQNFYSLWLSE